MERMDSTHLNGSLYNDSDFLCISFLPSEHFDARLTVLSIFLLSNFVVSLPANTWVLWLISRSTREVFASEIHFLSLAVCEIFFCLSLPAYLHCLFSSEQGYSLLVLMNLNWMILWGGRPIFQSCICLDRYFAVIHPVLYLRLKPLRYRVAWCANAWCLIISNIWVMTILERFGMMWFISTFCLLMFCSSSVLISLKRARPGDNKEKKRDNPMKRKAFNTMLINLASFILNYVPALIFQFLEKDMGFISKDLALCLALVSGQVQPLLYLRRAGKLTCAKRGQPDA